ncbi:MAG: carboxypeptidase regulatory-like domain-containing protein [Candidatus Bathyarchaeia archaeon]|nr:carboxypeptidase regulatory-like domain-containing protein [Candidatus Bathyarchaeota archaeon]
MNIEIDGIPLIRHDRDPDTGVTRSLRSVYNIGVSEKRRIVEHKIPGFEGSILQDLGREPVTISFEGIIFGEGAKEDLEIIWSKFKTGSSVLFSSDISGVAEVTQVLIEDLQIEDSGGAVNRYKYRMVLREYIIPQEEEEPAPSQEEDAAEEVEEETNDALASVNYITGKVMDADGNPRSEVSVKITWDGGEYIVKTNEEGIFRKDNLEPGKYKVIVDVPEYEGITREVEIKSGEE